MPKVSIIIVNYNTRELLCATLDSIFEHTSDLEFEVIVVDNASVDGSVEAVRALEPNRQVQLIVSTENLGFGRANNLGVANSSGEYIFYLNSDTLLRNNAVKILSQALDGNPRWGAVCGNLFTADGAPNLSFQPFHGLLFEFMGFMPNAIKSLYFKPNSVFNYSTVPRHIETISGADLMVRRNLAGFDPRFFMYYEDMELCYRISADGYCLMSIPNAEIIHLQGASQSNSLKRYELLFASKYIYYEITRSRFYARIIYLLNQFFYLIYQLSPRKRAKYRSLFGLNRSAFTKWSK